MLLEFFKFSNGLKSPAATLYKGYYDNNSFLMQFFSKEWFDLELYNYERLGHNSFIPKILQVDNKKFTIQIEYFPDNLNHLFYYNTAPKNWRDDVDQIKRSLEQQNFYKINFYPNTFFYKDKKLKIFDLYGCIQENDKITRDFIKNITHDKKRFHFQNNYLDVVSTYNYTIKHNYGNWP